MNQILHGPSSHPSIKIAIEIIGDVDKLEVSNFQFEMNSFQVWNNVSQLNKNVICREIPPDKVILFARIKASTLYI